MKRWLSFLFLLLASSAFGHAPVEGFAPPRLSLDNPTYASLAWRTRPVNVAGLIQLGERPYDYTRRAFLAADPLGHDADPGLNTAFGGNPAFLFDPTGRDWKQHYENGGSSDATGIERELRDLYNDYVASQSAAFGVFAATGDVGPLLQSHGFDAFLEDIVAGALQGDYAQRQSAGTVFGQTLAGFTPAGLAGDMRDISANIRNLGDGGWRQGGNWLGLGIATVAIVPSLDALKGGRNLSRVDNVPVPHAPRGGGRTPTGVPDNSSVGRIQGKLSLYPQVIDPRTGRNVAFPSDVGGIVPPAQRVQWGAAERGDFIGEWYRRGYETPRGGWENYDIHHVKPREFGGGNEFWNLVPVERQTHQNQFNSFWREFTGL